MAKTVAAATKSATKALDGMNAKLTKEREKLKALKEERQNYKDGLKAAIVSQFSFTTSLTRATESQTKAKEAAAKLTEAQEKYNDAVKTADVTQIKDALNELTAAQVANADATKNKKTFMQSLAEQAKEVTNFASKVKTLISMGLSKAGIDQVVAAGAEAGTAIADELIAGGAGAITKTNQLLASVESAAEQLGKSGASAFFDAGVAQGQAMVDGILNAIKKSGFRIVGGMAALPTNLQKALDSGSLTAAQVKELNTLLKGVPKLANGGVVNKPTLAMIGEAGPEAVVPLSGRRGGIGTTINVTVNAGMGSDGQVIGREIVDAIKRYERVSGPVFASA